MSGRYSSAATRELDRLAAALARLLVEWWLCGRDEQTANRDQRNGPGLDSEKPLGKP
jgi:hypothetical protein